MRAITTYQLNTFDVASKGKTISVAKGQRVSMRPVTGQGYIAQFWMTFPGWFWQHWDPRHPHCRLLGGLKPPPSGGSFSMG